MPKRIKTTVLVQVEYDDNPYTSNEGAANAIEHMLKMAANVCADSLKEEYGNLKIQTVTLPHD